MNKKNAAETTAETPALDGSKWILADTPEAHEHKDNPEIAAIERAVRTILSNVGEDADPHGASVYVCSEDANTTDGRAP